jgi:hypothetical protein
MHLVQVQRGRVGLRNLIYRFLTQDEGKPRTYGLVVDRRRERSAQANEGLCELAALANDHPGACAFGKIALLAAEGIFTFQVNRQGESLAVFCGNSTAAAIACLGGDRQPATALYGMAAVPYEVSSQAAAGTIVQTWTLPGCGVAERSWRGRRVLFLETLNAYAIVAGGLPDGVHPEAARRELLGTSGAGKLVVVANVGDCPNVRFYNSNGRHGAVPQTGMASLALAMRSADWLNEYFPGGIATYLAEGQLREAPLPLVAEAAQGRLQLQMPPIEVVLSPLVKDLAA